MFKIDPDSSVLSALAHQFSLSTALLLSSEAVPVTRLIHGIGTRMRHFVMISYTKDRGVWGICQPK